MNQFHWVNGLHKFHSMRIMVQMINYCRSFANHYNNLYLFFLSTLNESWARSWSQINSRSSVKAFLPFCLLVVFHSNKFSFHFNKSNFNLCALQWWKSLFITIKLYNYTQTTPRPILKLKCVPSRKQCSNVTLPIKWSFSQTTSNNIHTISHMKKFLT